MKAIPSAVAAVLATRTYFSARLYAITLVSGTTLYYSGADCDIKDPATGIVYSCGGFTGPYFEMEGRRAQLHQKLGTDVDQIAIDIAPGLAQVNGIPFMQAVRQRLFAGAQVQILEAIAPAIPAAGYWPVTVTGTYVLFTGFVAEIDGGSGIVTLAVNSALERLQSQWPRNIVAPTCVNVLGDAQCAVNLAALGVVGTVSTGSTAAQVLCGLSQADGYFDLGTLKFTSGVNNGLMRSVRSWASGTATLMVPFPNDPAVGDAFTITPGCDLTDGPNGCAKFNNLDHARMFLFVPAPTTAGN